VNGGPYRAISAVLAIVATGLGLAIVGVTASRGGGSTGYFIGAMFTVLGCLRFYILLRR
jgi:hypothetical protein